MGGGSKLSCKLESVTPPEVQVQFMIRKPGSVP